MNKQLIYEPTFLIIIDPTNPTLKNVTGYCSKIFEVKDYFNTVYTQIMGLKKYLPEYFCQDPNSKPDMEEIYMRANNVDLGFSDHVTDPNSTDHLLLRIFKDVIPVTLDRS